MKPPGQNGGRYEACFPRWQYWLPGQLAACGGFGGTSFVRWTITGQSADAQALRACVDRWPNLPLRTFLAKGDVGREIAGFAAEHADDAIVLVIRRRREPERTPILRAVLDRTPSPVLLVRGTPRRYVAAA